MKNLLDQRESDFHSWDVPNIHWHLSLPAGQFWKFCNREFYLNSTSPCWAYRGYFFAGIKKVPRNIPRNACFTNVSLGLDGSMKLSIWAIIRLRKVKVLAKMSCLTCVHCCWYSQVSPAKLTLWCSSRLEVTLISSWWWWRLCWCCSITRLCWSWSRLSSCCPAILLSGLLFPWLSLLSGLLSWPCSLISASSSSRVSSFSCARIDRGSLVISGVNISWQT